LSLHLLYQTSIFLHKRLIHYQCQCCFTKFIITIVKIARLRNVADSPIHLPVTIGRLERP